MLIDYKEYHTIKEVKNGQGPAPIKTEKGWLHIAHGVRNTAAGLRYVIYAFLSDLEHPEVVTHRPGGYLIAPEGKERVGDVSNVVFCNGAVARLTENCLYIMLLPIQGSTWHEPLLTKCLTILSTHRRIH